MNRFNDNPLFMLLLIAVLIGIVFNAVRLFKRTIGGAFILLILGLIATMLLVKTGFLEKEIVDKKIIETKNEVVEKASELGQEAVEGISENVSNAAKNAKDEIINKTSENLKEKLSKDLEEKLNEN